MSVCLCVCVCVCVCIIYVVSRIELYTKYKKYCEENKYTSYNEGAFKGYLEQDTGITYCKSHGVMCYKFDKDKYEKYLSQYNNGNKSSILIGLSIIAYVGAFIDNIRGIIFKVSNIVV